MKNRLFKLSFSLVVFLAFQSFVLANGGSPKISNGPLSDTSGWRPLFNGKDLRDGITSAPAVCRWKMD